ncbi:response regulator [Tsuneonella sp. HG249]
MLTALLAEDEMLVRHVAEEDLTEMGCAVTSAATGEEALARLQAGESFDLLVTDIRMPGQVDGWELARRAREILPGIHVIYVSGYPGETHDPVEHSRFVKKPYRLEQMREAITSLVAE